MSTLTSISAMVKYVGKLFGYNLPNATLQRKRVTKWNINVFSYVAYTNHKPETLSTPRLGVSY